MLMLVMYIGICCLFYDMVCFFIFFFFQAEDGIRDGHVTGVQTCALPISGQLPAWQGVGSVARVRSTRVLDGAYSRVRLCPRSEERRVGKECRSRWAPDH